MQNAIEILEEQSRWNARDVKYWSGPWDNLKTLIPEFAVQDFITSGESSPNPYLKTVVRLPLEKYEKPIPVGIVSNTYTLAQHRDVASKCIEGIKQVGIDPSDLRYELGLSKLGEWMNFRIYFPDTYNHTPQKGDILKLRLECYNSVDGTSRLIILLGWFRLICSNGMIIGETKTELRDIHNIHLNLEKIPFIISNNMEAIAQEKKRLIDWTNYEVPLDRITTWADSDVSELWGKKAACRIYHICKSGQDVEYEDPFEKSKPSEKTVKIVQDVPGAAKPSRTLFDVSQALSWIGSNRNDAEERISWQSDIPKLIGKLRTQ